MTEESEDRQEEARPGRWDCPMCTAETVMKKLCGSSKSWGHFERARIEMLKGLRTLIDECIEHAEKRRDECARRVSKIDIE